MGMFDTINVFMECPYCRKNQLFDAQTKDLDNSMYNYHIYRGKKDIIDRTKMPVFGITPNDKSAKVWKNQDEHSLAMATVPDEYKKLKFVNVIASCNSVSCQFDADRRDILQQGCPSGFGRHFYGKIKIDNGVLVGDIYDIEKDDLTERKLSRWKTLYPKEYKLQMRRYKHEPIACRHWNHKIKHSIHPKLEASKKSTKLLTTDKVTCPRS